MVIKAAAFDVYGTIIAYLYPHIKMPDTTHPPRPGLELLFDEFGKRDIFSITSSDVDYRQVVADLKDCFQRFPERRLSLSEFVDFVCLNQPGVKDYYVVLDRYELEPEELLVFDDVEDNVQAAKELGCKAVHCPRYVVGENGWSFRDVNLDAL